MRVAGEQMTEHMVMGVEASPAPHVTVGADLSGGTLQPKVSVVTVGTPGAAASFGVRFTKAAPGDVTGSLSLSAGVGVQVGWAASGQGGKVTDARLVVGGSVRLSVTAAVDVPLRYDSEMSPVSPFAPDATAVATTPIEQR